MVLVSNVARSMCYFYYVLGSLPSRTNLWSLAVMELDRHGSGQECNRSNTRTQLHDCLTPWIHPASQSAQNVIEVTQRPSSMTEQLNDCLAPQILPPRQTAQNVIEVIHGPSSEPCLAKWIRPAWQTAQNVIKVTHRPSSMKTQLHRFFRLGRLPRM